MFCAGTAGQDEHRDARCRDGAKDTAHTQSCEVSQAQEGHAEEAAGSGAAEAGAGQRRQLKTSDTTSVASDASTLSDLIYDAPWVRSNDPEPEAEPEVTIGDPLTRAEWDAFRVYHSTPFQ